MAETFFYSDPHFGHMGVCKFTRDDGSKLRPWDDPVTMTDALVEKWNAVVGVNDKVYVLGDVAMKKEWLSTMDRLKGSKRLIRGNHDVCKTKDYLRYFKEVYGVRVLDDMILSHIPLHRDCITERFQTNVHGHTHYRNIEDSAYYNVSVENIDFTPVTYDDLRERIRLNKEKYSAV